MSNSPNDPSSISEEQQFTLENGGGLHADPEALSDSSNCLDSEQNLSAAAHVRATYEYAASSESQIEMRLTKLAWNRRAMVWSKMKKEELQDELVAYGMSAVGTSAAQMRYRLVESVTFDMFARRLAIQELVNSDG